MIALQCVKADGTVRVREFANRTEAARFGVFYYLFDNGYASKARATAVANVFQRTGVAEHNGSTFALLS